MSVPPPVPVIRAFAAAGDPARLVGGEGRSWRVCDLVLKPTDNPEEASWSAAVLDGISEDGFRAQRPVRASNGSWVVDGWTAWRWLPGTHDLTGRWSEVLVSCRRFAGLAIRRTELVDAGAPARVIVSMTAEQLSTRSGLAETSFGQLLTVDDALRMADEASLHFRLRDLHVPFSSMAALSG